MTTTTKLRATSRFLLALAAILALLLAALGLSGLVSAARRSRADREEAARVEARNYAAELEVARRIEELGGNICRKSGAVISVLLDGEELSPEMGRLLARLPKLKGVHLYRPNDDCLANLVPVAQLKGLYVKEEGLTEEGLRYISALGGLKSLSLSRAALTDKGLQRLTSMRNLCELRVYGTRVTAAGVEQFGRARPDVAIGWDGGVLLEDTEVEVHVRKSWWRR